MKKLKKKICITILIICLLLIISMFCSYFMLWMSIPIYRVGSCLKLYTIDSKGDWPSSKGDLISKGYIKLIPLQSDEKFYEIKIMQDDQLEWHSGSALSEHGITTSREYFDRYSIKYGIKVEDLRLENNKLIDTKTGSRVLLIEGPFKFLLENEYRKVSVDLYKTMLEEKSKSLQTDSNEIKEQTRNSIQDEEKK